MASQQQTGRAASRARRQLQVNGKGRNEPAALPSGKPKRQTSRKVQSQAAPAVQPGGREHSDSIVLFRRATMSPSTEGY